MAKKQPYSNMVKNIGLLGIGIYALTKEKADAYVKSLQKSGALDKEAGKKLVKKMLAESKSQSVKIEKEIIALANESSKKMAVSSKKDVDKLEKRIAMLEKKLKKAKK